MKLIDWDAAYLPFAGLGGAGGSGTFGGAPDPPWRRRSARCWAARTRTPRCACRRSRRRSWSPACTTSTTATATRSASISSGLRGLGHAGADPQPGLRGDAVHHAGDRGRGRPERGPARAGRAAVRVSRPATTASRCRRRECSAVLRMSGSSSSRCCLAGCGASPTWTTARVADHRHVASTGRGRRVAGAKTPRRRCSRRRRRRAVARQLAAGAVGVQAFGGEVVVRPASLDTSADGGMVGVKWSAWGATSAAGAGSFSVQDCQPNCATGHMKSVPATVELSQVRCVTGSATSSRAVVTPATGAAPASYVRAPC